MVNSGTENPTENCFLTTYYPSGNTYHPSFTVRWWVQVHCVRTHYWKLFAGTELSITGAGTGRSKSLRKRAMDARPATALFRLPSLAPRSAAPPRVLLWWGITLICIGVLGFCFILYATLLSKLLPPSGVPILDAIRSDW